MVDFFENLKKNLSETAELVAKKTGEVADVVAKKTEQTVEVTKLKSQIHTMERNNSRDYADIGKMVYESFKNGDEVAEQFVELCEAIAEREALIAKMGEDVAELLGKDICPECKAHVETGAVYCSKCGATIVDVEVVDAEVEDANDIAEVVDEVSEEIIDEVVFEEDISDAFKFSLIQSLYAQ